MGGSAVSLAAALAFCLSAVSHGQPLYMLIAPNVLHVETEETVIVEAHGHHGPIEATITVLDFPQKKEVLDYTKASLNPENGMMNITKIKIPTTLLPKEAKNNQYVYLQARSPQFTLEKVVLVSFHSGYIFIQTDKPIYTPRSTVKYRLFTVSHMLDPNLKSVSVEVMNPDGIVVEKNMVSSPDQSGIIYRTYKIPEIVNNGIWKIICKYQHAPQETFTVEFEVKEYVLPSFEVTLEPSQKFFYFNDHQLTIDITAKFLYGKPVQGHAYALFGIIMDKEKKSIADSLHKVPIQDGKGCATLTGAVLRRRFPKPDQLLGHSIYVTVTVLTDTGSDMVEAEKSGIRIVSSPYEILFTRSSSYFKPGMPYSLMVSVVNPDGTPAPQVPVRSGPSTGPRGLTQDDGTIQLVLNTPLEASQLWVKVQTEVVGLPKARQSFAVWSMDAYRTQGDSGNYLHISVSATVLKPEDTLTVNFNLRNSIDGVKDQIQYFTYLLKVTGASDQDNRMQAPGASMHL